MRVGFGPNLADSCALISGLAWQFPESAPEPFILGQISAYERHNISQIEAIQPTNGDVNASPIMCGDTILIVSRISRVLHKQTFLLCPHVSLVQSKKLRSEGYGMSLNR
uniref:Uncharacterized protein n=1 Tax=Pristionchus pacificus TaxID=54126 RepID=A0A2A6C3L6_PRIPA|eukprot:PDM72719.1 hypothetical protein PRIPAC_39153 [Pristionchus pacificus]